MFFSPGYSAAVQRSIVSGSINVFLHQLHLLRIERELQFRLLEKTEHGRTLIDLFFIHQRRFEKLVEQLFSSTGLHLIEQGVDRSLAELCLSGSIHPATACLIVKLIM